MLADMRTVVVVVALAVAAIAAMQLLLRSPSDPTERRPATGSQRGVVNTEVDIDGDNEADGIRVNGRYIDFDAATTVPYVDHRPRTNPRAGADLDCSDLAGPVPVGPADPHGLDRDNDGVGCE